ncbi:hypothetical protein EI94DRAFT_1293253 [Lactarius quietus]|nr:hypothetical protein EI94DRAFT_1293253 [Lactarius quietus]
MCCLLTGQYRTYHSFATYNREYSSFALLVSVLLDCSIRCVSANGRVILIDAVVENKHQFPAISVASAPTTSRLSIAAVIALRPNPSRSR